MKLCLTVLMGLPGSGKTTFAERLKNDFKNYDGKHFNFIHVCYDELLPRINYQEHEDGDTKWKDLRTGVANEIDLLISSVKNDRLELCPEKFKSQLELSSPDTVIVIIIDDNMYLRSMRYALYKKAKQFSISYCQVYFMSSVEFANKRNLSRSSEEVVPLNVISQMCEKIEGPRPYNKWERHSLLIEAWCAGDEVYTYYFSMLQEALHDPECVCSEDDLADRQRDRLICMENVLHQCDISIRRIISERIQQYKCKNGSGKDLKDFSAELRLKKEKILSEIRSGAIQVPVHVLSEIRESNLPEKKFLKKFLDGFIEEFGDFLVNL